VGVIALADQRTRGRRFAHRAHDLPIRRVKDRHRTRGHYRPITLLEIGDAAGQWRQCQRVRTQEHLTLAIADGEWTAAAGADQEVVLAGKQKDERKDALDPRQGFGHRLLRRQSLPEKMCRQNRHRLSIGVGLEDIAEPLELTPQPLEILDNPVVGDGNPVGDNWMGIGLCGQTMGRPAGVPDADHPVHGLLIEAPGEVDEFALGPAALDVPIGQRRDTGRIIPAIFEASQPFKQPGCH